MLTPKTDSLDDESNIPFLDLNNTDKPQPRSINDELVNYLLSLLNEVGKDMHQYGAVYRCDIPQPRLAAARTNHLIVTLHNLNELIEVLDKLTKEPEYIEQVSEALMASSNASQTPAPIQTEQTAASEKPATSTNNLSTIGFFSKPIRHIPQQLRDEEELELRGERSGKIARR